MIDGLSRRTLRDKCRNCGWDTRLNSSCCLQKASYRKSRLWWRRTRARCNVSPFARSISTRKSTTFGNAASIDRGQIRAGAAKLGICELELELKHGAASDLFNLASRLVSQALLRPDTISKAERGYLLADGAWGRAVKGTRPRLDAKMPCWQAFQEIVRIFLADLHLNMPLMENFGEMEGIHQGRIAIRRLRAAMTLFKPVVSDMSFRRLSSETKWLGRLLGAARDLDVLLASF